VTFSSLAIVKVGGSLFDWPELPRRMTAFLDACGAGDRGERVLLIAGGGPAADLVRGLDRIHGLGDETAHRLALEALDLTAHFLAALIPNAVLIDRNEHLVRAWRSGCNPVLSPRPILDEFEHSGKGVLPASWDVTSDSIAARIALHLKADRLILLKSVSAPAGTTRDDAARLGLVDPMLPVVAQALPRIEYQNFRERAAQLQLLLP
jgi:aspartokinase-like uncharacterized kinase